ncbi:MAG: hypothetical protein ACRDIE_02890 [Chloroflexota bacterium]
MNTGIPVGSRRGAAARPALAAPARTAAPAVLLGLLAALFFSVTFLLNRKMGLEGGDWGWAASLRFLLMAVLLAIPVTLRREWRPLLRELAGHRLTVVC